MMSRLPWESDRVFIVAEIGVNHNRSVDLARRLIDAAASAGACAVKFQTFVPEESAAAQAPLTADQAAGGVGTDMLEMIRSLCLDEVHWPGLIAHARARGLEVFSTPFDLPSLALLRRLGVGLLKIPSGEIVNLPLIRAMAQTGLPGILSTGMSNLAEIRRALEVWDLAGGGPIAVLHCTSTYPSRPEELNLRAIPTLAREFGRPVGFSDHSRGHVAAVAAVALGARIIEKHFTLAHELPGPDHAASATPDEFRELVRSVRATEKALGDGKKKPVAREGAVRDAARRSLFFRRPLTSGTVVTEDDFVAWRPGTGFPVERIDEIIGRPLAREVVAGEPLSEEMFSDCLALRT
ncbi:MAG: N-acetylneuraminate synthase family protein [Planctomycetes bacterium]|nr:N-acetylneuraminate synthase family protein [Planctomycetota bacterium]